LQNTPAFAGVVFSVTELQLRIGIAIPIAEKIMKRTSLSLILTLGVLAAAPCLADTLLIERVRTESSIVLPKRGSSMAAVETAFGVPVRKFAAVGGGSHSTPPITRWQYETFSVYFENDHVVDAVLNKANPLEIGPAPATR